MPIIFKTNRRAKLALVSMLHSAVTTGRAPARGSVAAAAAAASGRARSGSIPRRSIAALLPIVRIPSRSAQVVVNVVSVVDLFDATVAKVVPLAKEYP